MKILFLAPQPFYEERGTPIAVRWALEALAGEGHHIDLLTFKNGRDVSIDGVQVKRIGGPAFKSMPIGFSLKKVCCDLFMLFDLVAMLRRHSYDVVHANEESVFLALLVKPFIKARLVYDMDSSMADQLLEKYQFLRPVGPLLNAFERLAVRGSDLILPVCERLAEKVRGYGANDRCYVLHDVAIETNAVDGSPVDDISNITRSGKPVVLYVGNLEPYQGTDLILQAAAHPLIKERVDFVFIGGRAEDVRAGRIRADKLGVGGHVFFAGPRPVEHLQEYLRQADVLLSPRDRGLNTPLKIYSYMLSGVPIVATRILSHTQVLSDTCAALVEPNGDALALGIAALLDEPDRAASLGSCARERAQKEYSRTHYRAVMNEAYHRLEPL